METNGEDAVIHTPLELDLAARSAERRIERNASPLRRFSILTGFFRRTHHLPEVWTASYYRGLYSVLSTCVRHEYVCWTDPAQWQLVVDVLQQLRNKEWVHEDVSFGETESAAWEKCAATLACMGAFRELHTVLQSHGRSTADISAEAWIRVFTARSLGKDAFREYLHALSVHDAVPPFLTKAIDRLQHAFADGVRPGVVLVDDAAGSASSPALILHPEIQLSRSAAWRVHINNALAEDNTASHRQMAHSVEAARRMVAAQFHSHLEPRSCVLRFHEHDAEYTGESMGLAVALQLLELLQMDFNRAMRWKLRLGLCCTGGVEEDGTVRPVSQESLRSKVSAAFFSPCEAMVLHASHLEDAHAALLELRMRWPAGRLELYGVTTLEECAASSGIIEVIPRTPYDRSREFVRRHATLLLLGAVMILLLAAGYFWWKSMYGYPDLEYAHGAPIGENALVYNPRHAEDWQFRDFSAVRKAILPFGDLEIGADATRNVWLWNMTPSTLDVVLAIEGPQADQWYISWNDGAQSINPTDSLRVMVKYVPTRESSANSAMLTVRDPRSGDILTKLDLNGSAGPPLPAGYALYFDGVDDLLHFGEDAIAFSRDEGTLEFWFRLDTASGCVFSNNRNIPYGPAIQNMTLELQNSAVVYNVGNNRGNTSTAPKRLSATGAWHHFALAFSRQGRSIRLYLDGGLIDEKQEEFIIEGYMRPFVTFGAYHNGESLLHPFKGALDEIRMWDTALPQETIRARMKSRVGGLTEGLLGYWDFDALSEVSAHNANERTQDGLLMNRPSYIRSGAPLQATPGPDIALTRGPDGRPAVELQPARWLQCGSDPLGGSPERSYAIRFRRAPRGGANVLTVINQNAHLTVLDAWVRLSGKDTIPLPSQAGWNHLIVRIDRRQHAEFILNGVSVYTLSSNEFARGPTYRYEGLQIGIYNDKYNNFGPKYYDECRPMLLRTLAVRDFSVWRKRLTLDEIQSIERGKLPRDQLAAHWPLDGQPDSDNNFRDDISGHVLHLWRYPAWL